MPRLIKHLIAGFAGCVLVVLVIELISFLLLGAIALRQGHLSTYFSALWPHPAISRRATETARQHFFLGVHAGFVGYGGGGIRGRFEWYPLVGHYRTVNTEDGRALRDRPTFHPKELGVYLLGGSVAEQRELSVHLQAHLQARLQDRYEVHVFNEGVGGFMSTQELVLLETKILPFGNPHYVIALDGYNDWLSTIYTLLGGLKERTGVTADVWPSPELSWFHHWFTEWQARQAIETVSGSFSQFAGVVSKRILLHTYTGWLVNHVMTWIRRNEKHPSEYVSQTMYAKTPTLPSARAELQAINERMMAEACRARGARFFWVLQPGLPYRGDAKTAEEGRFYDSRPSVYWGSLERYYQDVRRIVKRDAQFWHSRFLDLSHPPREVTGSFFVDTVHLTDAGADQAMQSVAALILKDLASRPIEQSSSAPAIAQDEPFAIRR